MIELKTEIDNAHSIGPAVIAETGMSLAIGLGRIVIAVSIFLSVVLGVSAPTIVSDVSYKT